MKRDEVDRLVSFAEENVWGYKYSTSDLKRFVTELISNDDFVFQLPDEQGIVAAAVLLDQVQNPANDANLEFLGKRKDADPADTLLRIVAWAKGRLPAGRAGIQIGIEDSPELEEVLKGAGFENYYDTYDMLCTEFSKGARGAEVSEAKASESLEVYRVLCEAFAQNPETSIPNVEIWNRSFMKSPTSKYFVWRENETIKGFAHFLEREADAEVRTIGVLPHHRGSGIGKKLLLHCLDRAAAQKYSACHLTVAVSNESALNLYRQAGFKVLSKYKCLRWPRDK